MSSLMVSLPLQTRGFGRYIYAPSYSWLMTFKEVEDQGFPLDRDSMFRKTTAF